MVEDFDFEVLVVLLEDMWREVIDDYCRRKLSVDVVYYCYC